MAAFNGKWVHAGIDPEEKLIDVLGQEWFNKIKEKIDSHGGNAGATVEYTYNATENSMTVKMPHSDKEHTKILDKEYEWTGDEGPQKYIKKDKLYFDGDTLVWALSSLRGDFMVRSTVNGDTAVVETVVGAKSFQQTFKRV